MKGSYVLVLNLAEEQLVAVGKLGTFRFPAGHYLYFGSALNGLEGRLRRHLRSEKKLHWHIDYLAAVSRVVDVWWIADEARRECEWAACATGVAGVSIPAPKFGSSDCRCTSHLMYGNSIATVESVRNILEPRPSQAPPPAFELPISRSLV